ncbi:MAG TPA: SDR family NAD(P)-dependent oxidoreductase [Candidatus Acidoferrum sp.]|nr:SDR family NAD(P)-dependent oxidoreductase [Candidatus Acidoferrum sp.]
MRNKVAIVTGAGAGIGRAIALRFGIEGAQVVVNDINAATAEDTARAIVAAGGSASGVAADVADKAQVDRLFDVTLERYRTIDVLVNNASLTNTSRHFLAADEAWWDRILAVNLKSTFLCAWRAAQVMARRRQGAIINMSSGGASRAHRGNAAYDAAKGGVEALTRALALDLGPYGVRVNALVPGSINSHGLDEATLRERGKTMPLGRVGDVDELAGPAVFLASDDATYVTGHLLVVDGGLLAQQRSAPVDIFPPSLFPQLE